MNDLTRITGIGKATAAKLADAGVDSFRALADLTDPLPEGLDRLGSDADWQAWRAQATALAAEDGSPGAPANAETLIASAGFERLAVSTANRSVKRRRRAGLVFTRDETTVDPESLGEDGMVALCNDPALRVEMVLTNGQRFRLTRFPPDEADVASLLDLAEQEARSASGATGTEEGSPAQS